VLTRRAGARFSSRYSREESALPQHVVVRCLEVKKATEYRDFGDELVEVPASTMPPVSARFRRPRRPVRRSNVWRWSSGGCYWPAHSQIHRATVSPASMQPGLTELGPRLTTRSDRPSLSS